MQKRTKIRFDEAERTKCKAGWDATGKRISVTFIDCSVFSCNITQHVETSLQLNFKHSVSWSKHAQNKSSLFLLLLICLHEIPLNALKTESKLFRNNHFVHLTLL